jgi:hypothetical protein
MLVLKRKEGQWVDIIHKNGDKLRIRVYRIREGYPSQLDMAFDDELRNFEIQRPERKPRLPEPGVEVEAEVGHDVEAESEFHAEVVS